ncbi:hypothetical protein BD769DRAFT_1751355 [Suillus cothurnatus]|nr:hypothetical protein BD769DRAFT_1751355 [Suillus cothurnatus]
MELDSKLRQKFKCFRILIIGRANAGKTTILQRVCKTQENPEIYNSDGEQIDPAVLTASREVGCILDGCNPGFVFHDSRGFEAGGQFEFNKVKAFISRRSKEKHLSDQIYVIWYCIPMDEDGRSFTEAEVKFFSQCDTGSIVVIVLFTKFDALYDDEFAELICKGVSRKDAQALAAHHAKEAFASGPQLKLLYNRKGNHRHPRCHICLPDMDKDNADCRPLIELTAETLDNDTLKRMFVSTQRTTLELCMRYAVKRSLARHLDTTQAMTSCIFGKSDREIVNDLGKWFPQTTMMAWDDNDDGGADIGKQWAGARRNSGRSGEERVLASNELALDTTSGRSGFLASNELALDAIQGGAGIGKQWAGARRNSGRSGEERVLASNVLALDVMGYKRDLARIARLWKLLGDSAIRQLPTGRGMHEYTEGIGETCSDVKRRIDVARHGDTCNMACASSFSDDNQWEFTHQWSIGMMVMPTAAKIRRCGHHCDFWHVPFITACPHNSHLKAAVIVFENVFYLLDWQEELMSVHPIRVALRQYTASPNAAAVRVALSSAVHTYEIGFSRWIAGSVKHSHKKADLIKTITEVVLSHRLPIPGVQAI